MEWLRSSYEINMGALLVLALAAGLYILRTAVARKPKVFVLDFAVHRPHDRWAAGSALPASARAYLHPCSSSAGHQPNPMLHASC
jgi:hypothetical protein